MRTLNVLIISDHESEFIWDYFDRSVFKDVELIISCGDLKPTYLSFLVTMLPVPLLYVPGNHDHTLPEGCINLDEHHVFVYKGFRFLGFGGCKSNYRKLNHYRERDMCARVRHAKASVMLHGGFDVLVTHAAARGLGDGEDFFHQGFACFRRLLDQWQPAYHLHGHQHLSYSYRQKRVEEYGKTVIINGYNYYLTTLTLPDKPVRHFLPLRVNRSRET